MSKPLPFKWHCSFSSLTKQGKNNLLDHNTYVMQTVHSVYSILSAKPNIQCMLVKY